MAAAAAFVLHGVTENSLLRNAGLVIVAVVLGCRALAFFSEMTLIVRWIDRWRDRVIASPFRPALADDFEANVQGAVVCTNCDSAFRAEDRQLACDNCGSPLWLTDTSTNEQRKFVGSFPMWETLFDGTYGAEDESGKALWLESNSPNQRERFASEVSCNWCGEQYENRPASASCPRCGGVLPVPDSFELEQEPPPSPRRLPWRYLIRHFFRFNRMGVMGPIVFGVGAALYGVDWVVGTMCGIPLMVLGTLQTYLAFVRRVRRFRALRNGTAVQGMVETVSRTNSSGKYNVYRMHFRFDVEGRPVRGVAWVYNRTIENYFVGQRVWVLCIPGDPACNELWPPVA